MRRTEKYLKTYGLSWLANTEGQTMFEGVYNDFQTLAEWEERFFYVPDTFEKSLGNNIKQSAFTQDGIVYIEDWIKFTQKTDINLAKTYFPENFHLYFIVGYNGAEQQMAIRFDMEFFWKQIKNNPEFAKKTEEKLAPENKFKKIFFPAEAEKKFQRKITEKAAQVVQAAEVSGILEKINNEILFHMRIDFEKEKMDIEALIEEELSHQRKA